MFAIYIFLLSFEPWVQDLLLGTTWYILYNNGKLFDCNTKNCSIKGLEKKIRRYITSSYSFAEPLTLFMHQFDQTHFVYGLQSTLSEDVLIVI